MRRAVSSYGCGSRLDRLRSSLVHADGLRWTRIENAQALVAGTVSDYIAWCVPYAHGMRLLPSFDLGYGRLALRDMH